MAPTKSEADCNASKTSDVRTTHLCASCKGEATLCCNGCLSSEDGNDLAHRTWYCNADCQIAHWKVHKSLCKEYQERSRIYRAGEVLQAVFYQFREHAFDFPVKEVRKQNDTELFLKAGEYSDCQVYPFPQDPVLTEDDKHAIMTYCCCGDALGFMFWFAKELLDGIYTTIEEIRFRPDDLQRTIVLCDEFGERTNSTMSHEVFRVTTKRGKQYILDITGAQFGYRDSVMPLNQYQVERIITVDFVGHFGYNHDQIQNKIRAYLRPRMPFTEFNVHVAQQHYLSTRIEKVEAEYRAWLKSMKLSTAKFLKEPKQVFQSHLEELIAKVNHLLVKYNARKENQVSITRFKKGKTVRAIHE